MRDNNVSHDRENAPVTAMCSVPQVAAPSDAASASILVLWSVIPKYCGETRQYQHSSAVGNSPFSLSLICTSRLNATNCPRTTVLFSHPNVCKASPRTLHYTTLHSTRYIPREKYESPCDATARAISASEMDPMPE